MIAEWLGADLDGGMCHNPQWICKLFGCVGILRMPCITICHAGVSFFQC